MLKRFLGCLLTFLLAFTPLGAVFHSVPAVAGEIKPAGEEKSKQELLEAYQKLPLYFIENRGQLNEEVLYYAKLPQGTVYFTGEKVVFQVVEKKKQDKNSALSPESRVSDGQQAQLSRQVSFSLNFAGANKNVRPKALGLNEGKVNYLTGSDPAKWRTGIPTYREVVYQSL